jgi:hypothetical protein
MVKPRKRPNKVSHKKIVEPSDVEVAKKLLNIYQSAMDRKLEFNLSFESVKTLLKFQTCYYTGRKFDNDGPYGRSIDRIDSSKGYIDGNVVSCTVDINGKKSNLSDDEIELLYNKIVLHKKKVVEESVDMEILTPDGSYIPEEGDELISEEFVEYETQFSEEGSGLDQDQEDVRP